MSMLTSRLGRRDRGAAEEPVQPAAAPAEAAPDTGTAEMPDTSSPLTGDGVTPAGVAAAAERFTAAAAAVRDRADRDRAEAERVLADARAEVARIVAEAEATARPLARSAEADDAEAARLAESARVLGCESGIAATAEKAEKADALVAQLEAERDRLTADVAGIGEELAGLAADRRQTDARLAEADESGDLDAAAAHIARTTAIDRRSAKLERDRATALARLDEIGTGEMLPTWPQKLLADAITQAGNHHGSVRTGLNWIWPERDEAVADRKREEWRLILEAQSERIRGEQAAAGKPEGRTVLRGQQGQVVVKRG